MVRTARLEPLCAWHRHGKRAFAHPTAPRRGDRVNRRTFTSLLAGAAAASHGSWPLAARAETVVRRVGLLSTLVPDTGESQRVMDVFIQALRELGWHDGQ